MTPDMTIANRDAFCQLAGVTRANLDALLDTPNPSDDAKKWKDLFLKASALWLNCEVQRIQAASTKPAAYEGVDQTRADRA